MHQAALQIARRGWPVFPCRENDLIVTKRDGSTQLLKAKAPYTGAGWKDATTDETVIGGWWRRNPNAMVGVNVEQTGFFIVDFDPRTEEQVDEETGEVTVHTWTLEQLKADLEAQMGVPLPQSATSRTPSGGVHVWFRQPDDGGPRIRNRGNLPDHVDVRGDGGYVVLPPSYCEGGLAEGGSGAAQGHYGWLRERGDWRDDASFAPAPAELIAILRAPKVKAGGDRAPASSHGVAPRPSPRPSRRPSSPPPRGRDDAETAAIEAIRKYGDRALLDECRKVRTAGSGSRNGQLNESAFNIATLVDSVPFPALDAGEARSMLESAARDNPGRDDDAQLIATIDSGWNAGAAQPRDLTYVAEAAARRRRRPHRSPSGSAAPSTPPSDRKGEPSSQAGGKAESAGEAGAGRVWDAALTLTCAQFAMTDIGNLERFVARFGADFLHVPAWDGYIAWDRIRWNRNQADALFGRAAQETLRLIQEEAAFIRASGVPFPPEEGDLPPDPDDEDDENPDEEAAASDDPSFAEKAFLRAEAKREKRRSQLWYLQRSLARQTRHDGPRHDYIAQVKSNGDYVLYSDKLAAWGRTSESSGHIDAIRKHAPARLSARPEDFDADPLALNVQNGTIVFARPGDGKPASFELREHRREDRITKVARALYVPGAQCPQYQAFLTKVQPAEDMREFLRRWSGYNALGLADAQVMALFYGEGSNGKGVWVQTHAHILGDYAWATGIETFMDSGFKRNGGGPSPHLAALAGRRMVYANEPEDNSKFSDGLVKSLTSDEPIGGVRELFGPAFELLITFKNTVMANNLPRIGTDFGIRRRMQVVPWDVIIPKDQQDKRLKDKLREEMSGILNEMITGALAYLNEGLTMPEAMVEATKSYHDDNDLLGQFLMLCLSRAPGERLGATALHEVFAAWQAWAGLLPQNGQAWSKKKLRQEMERKGFKIDKSSTMKWWDIVLRFDAIDFVVDGKPVERDLPPPRHADKPSAGLPAGAPANGPPQEDAPPVPPSALPPSSFDDDDDLPP